MELQETTSAIFRVGAKHLLRREKQNIKQQNLGVAHVAKEISA